MLFLVLLVFLPSLFIYGLIKYKTVEGKTILVTYSTLFAVILTLVLTAHLSKKMTLNKPDFYGQYTVNRDYFKGKQADWQYDNFRFEIFKNDSIYFYETHGKEIIHTYRGTIETVDHYSSSRLKIKMDDPHHVLYSNPTIYREAWSFNLVFLSPKFKNMYFHKKEWKTRNKKWYDVF